jgi:hypothetical protein
VVHRGRLDPVAARGAVRLHYETAAAARSRRLSLLAASGRSNAVGPGLPGKGERPCPFDAVSSSCSPRRSPTCRGTGSSCCRSRRARTRRRSGTPGLAKYYFLLGKELERKGKAAEAIDAYLEYLIYAPVKGELLPSPEEPALKVKPQVWVRQRVGQLLDRVKGEERKKLEKRIEEKAKGLWSGR